MSHPRLIRSVGLFSLTALAVNNTVGSGILVLPAQVAQLLGRSAMWGYVIAATAIALTTLCFAEAGSLFEQSGGPYLYARAAFGELAGFEVGLMIVLARTLAIAAVSNAFAGYLAVLWAPAAGGAGRALVITALIGALTAINLWGVRYGAWASNALTVSKLAPLLLFVAAGLFALDPQRGPVWEFPRAAGLSQAALLLVFAFGGFEMASIPGEEIIHPKRNVGVALMAAVAIVTALYLGIQYVAQGTLPGLATSATPLEAASRNFLGPSGALLLTVGAILSTTGTNSSILLLGPRLIYGMAETGSLPSVFARVHPRYRTPYIAIGTVSGLGWICALYGGFAGLAAVSAIARTIAYMATCASVPVLRHKFPDVPRLLRIPGGPAIPLAAVAIFAWVLSGSSAGQFAASAGVLAAGALFHFGYGAITRRSRPAGP